MACRRSTYFKPGTLVISSASALIRHADPPKGDYESLTLYINSERVAEILPETEDRYTEACSRMLREPGGEPLMLCSSFGAEAVNALRRIEACPFHGALQRMYLEGKALELTALSFGFLLKEELPKPRPLHARDLRKMKLAREYLDSRIGNPPTLTELAAYLGVSLAKLKRDFALANGMNVHEYVVSAPNRRSQEVHSPRRHERQRGGLRRGLPEPESFCPHVSS
ncbi:MAG: hypothetical protein AB1798_07495 [Spirochaetota bacterium]